LKRKSLAKSGVVNPGFCPHGLKNFQLNSKVFYKFQMAKTPSKKTAKVAKAAVGGKKKRHSKRVETVSFFLKQKFFLLVRLLFF
jgi:hypothetical protein